MENSMKNVHTLTDGLAFLARLLLGQIFLTPVLAKLALMPPWKLTWKAKASPPGCFRWSSLWKQELDLP
jgi:hypothetical protein